MTDNLLTPEHWRSVDAAEAGTTATDYLDTAAGSRLSSEALIRQNESQWSDGSKSSQVF